MPGLSPNFRIHVERYIYPQDRSAYSASGKYVVQFWEYINRSQTKAAQFLFWEYINGIFVAVYSRKEKGDISNALSGHADDSQLNSLD